MIHREVEEFDIRKLEQARDLVDEVAGYYYMSINSRDLCSRLETVTKKLTSLIFDAREYRRTHDRFGNRKDTYTPPDKDIAKHVTEVFRESSKRLGIIEESVQG